MARNSQIGPYVYPAVPAEFTNWRDEQVAWREGCALFNQSHHMTDLYIKGPDVIKLLSALGVNTFDNFAVNKAKQFVACNPDGYVIGDGILFFLDENSVSLVGRPSAHNWVQYHAETGDYDVEVERDERTAANPTGRRKLYRFQVQGPTALEVMEAVTGGRCPRSSSSTWASSRSPGTRSARCITACPARPGWSSSAPGRKARRSRRRSWKPAASHGLKRVGSQGLRDEHARVGLDPVPAARDLHGRRAEGLPRVAAGERLRGHGLARRQLLLGRRSRTTT